MNGGDCASEDASTSHSDIYILLAWIGNDKDGQACSSLNFLPSKFQQYTVQPIYNAVYSTVSSTFGEQN